MAAGDVIHQEQFDHPTVTLRVLVREDGFAWYVQGAVDHTLATDSGFVGLAKRGDPAARRAKALQRAISRGRKAALRLRVRAMTRGHYGRYGRY